MEIKLKDHYFVKIQLVLEKTECKKDKLDFQAMIYEQLHWNSATFGSAKVYSLSKSFPLALFNFFCLLINVSSWKNLPSSFQQADVPANVLCNHYYTHSDKASWLHVFPNCSISSHLLALWATVCTMYYHDESDLFLSFPLIWPSHTCLSTGSNIKMIQNITWEYSINNTNICKLVKAVHLLTHFSES